MTAIIRSLLAALTATAALAPGALAAQSPSRGALVARIDSIVRARAPAARVLFETGGGRVTGFVIDRGSRPFAARRIP